MLNNPKTALAIAHDVVACGVAWVLAYLLRLNLDYTDPFFSGAWKTLPWVIPTQAVVFLAFGLYRGIWRYASLPDLKRIVLAAAVATMATALLLKLLPAPGTVPRSVFILDPILLVMLMGGSRLAYRTWKERRLLSLHALEAQPVLVLGAGDAGASLAKALARSSEWRVVGFLDDDSGKHGRQVHGLPVLGPIDALPRHAARCDVKHAIVALPSASHAVRRRAVEVATRAGLRALTVPSFDDLVSGRVSVSSIRQVELDDLLGRDPVMLDTVGLREWLSGRTVLVTGAGGSIGAELCRQIARFAPARLIMLELNEFALYRMEQEFAEQFKTLPVACLIGDVKNRLRMEQVLDEYRPDVVFHAAAYKHVPLMEEENAWEAVQNNVLGTLVMAEASRDREIGKFVFVSTDKAVNPVSVMGATKRLAEMVCQALQRPSSPSPVHPGQGKKSATQFIMVRFGNVLGSAGSVIPKFKEQIARGGPVTVTHPEITRYFMSIPEACQLVLQAGLMGKGGEIFVMDMGEPVKIVDLARDLIRLSGFTEDDIKIAFTGLRPGEKLYEEPLADGETTLPTPHPKLRIARARNVDPGWLDELRVWLMIPPVTPEKLRSELARWVPEYRPYGDTASGVAVNRMLA
jgi:FlaA1/EpsC-like NDP-sugar epimerase